MSPDQIARHELRKASSWYDACLTQRANLEARVAAAIAQREPHVGPLRQQLRGAENACSKAHEEVRGWETLIRRARYSRLVVGG